MLTGVDASHLVIAYSAKPSWSGCGWNVPMQPRKMCSSCSRLNFFQVTNNGLWREKKGRKNFVGEKKKEGEQQGRERKRQDSGGTKNGDARMVDCCKVGVNERERQKRREENVLAAKQS